MKFYKQVLNKKALYTADSSINSVIKGENSKFISSSSCLIKNPNNNGYFSNIRYVNYYIEDNGSYSGCDKHIISINKFVEFDNNFNVIKEEWMDLLFDGRLYIGVEDVKIYYDNYKNKLLYIGTGYHSNNQIGIVSGEYELNEKRFNINELKQTFNKTSCEKNWVFVDYKEETHVIYDWNPLRICNIENNNLNVVDTKKMPNIFLLPSLTVDLDTSAGKDQFERYCNDKVNSGYEGVMIKDLSAPYVCKRNTNWLKYKPVHDYDLQVVDLEVGTGKNLGRLGALIC
jgi:hypothetical protein